MGDRLFDLSEIGSSLQQPERIPVAFEQLDGQVARRIVRHDVAVLPDQVLERGDTSFDVFPVIDMDVAYRRFVVFEHRYHAVEQPVDPFAFGSDGRHDRNPDHASQRFVVELRAAGRQFVVHVQGDHHFQVHVDQLGGQEQVAFEVRGVHHIDHHVRHLFQDMPPHVQLLRRIFRDRIGARQVGQPQGITATVRRGLFGLDRDSAVVAHPLVRTAGEVEQRRFAAVGIPHQRHVDRSSGFVSEPVGRLVFPDHLYRRTGGSFVRTPVFRHFDQFRFAAPQGDMVPHDFILDGIQKRSVFNHRHPFAADESHLRNTFTERPVAEHFRDDAALGGR